MAYLNKTPKRYNLDLTQIIEGTNGYTEDENGDIGGVSYTCDNGDYGYIIFDWLTSYTASFQQRFVRFEFKQFHYVSSIAEWTIKKPNLFKSGNISKVDDTGYCDSSGNVVDYETAHEDDLTKQIYEEDGTTIKGYEQKMKQGYKTEYQFWFDNLGMGIINAGQSAIINRLI
jgi:hypothetical protein